MKLLRLYFKYIFEINKRKSSFIFHSITLAPPPPLREEERKEWKERRRVKREKESEERRKEREEGVKRVESQ